MHYVYILRSKKFPQKVYRGHTANLRERLADHNSGSSPYTSKFRPWVVAFYCAFSDERKALNFEKYLKTASGIAFSNKRLI